MTTITHDKPYINCQLKDQGYYGSWKKKKRKTRPSSYESNIFWKAVKKFLLHYINTQTSNTGKNYTGNEDIHGNF